MTALSYSVILDTLTKLIFRRVYGLWGVFIVDGMTLSLIPL